LQGLKENVIMGRLIPAGTGAAAYRGLKAVVAGSKGHVAGEVAGEAVAR
jgi:hypothetical protein